MPVRVINNACRLLLVYYLICGLLFPTNIFALPQDSQVVSGDISINQTDISNMQINQGSDKAIINWGSFSISSGEAVIFLQPGSSSVVLNRVTGIDPSVLNGLLSANGRVFLINPNGITVGPSGVINVGAFLASTTNISNEDFMAGNYAFRQDVEKPLSYIINNGTINASEFAVLSAPAVLNTGEIKVSGLPAVAGKVYLTSSGDLILNFSGDELIGFTIDGAIKDEILGPDGQLTNANVTNTGTIKAEGGEVILSARTAYDAVKLVVNNEGIIEATSIVNKNGIIILDGGDNGIVSNSGTLDASASPSVIARSDSDSSSVIASPDIFRDEAISNDRLGTGSTILNSEIATPSARNDNFLTGGTVKVLGEYVGLFDGSNIDVSGDSGGGTVLIGGNLHGKGPESNAFRTFVGENTTINADAINTGDGGTVIVWADDVTRFYGNISARGGSVSGDGGFVEVSGKESLYFNGTVNALAPNGTIGTLLLDPKNITISDSGSPTPLTDVDAFADGGGANNATLDVDTLNAAGANVTLQANNDITIANMDATTKDVNITTAGVTLTMQAGRSIAIYDNITTNNGAITITANETTANGVQDANRDAGAATITLADGKTINAGNQNIIITLSTGAGLTNSTSGDITLENLSTTGHVLVANDGPTAGSGILRTSADALITVSSVALDVNGAGGGGEIGTSANPIRITGYTGATSMNIDAQAQSAGVYLQAIPLSTFTSSYTAGTIIGGAYYGTSANPGGRAITGVSTADSTVSGVASGSINITATNAVTNKAIVISEDIKTGDATVVDAAGDTTATSGNITILNQGTASWATISGSARVITGNATLTGVSADGTDSATSGNITLTSTGRVINLTNSNAVQIGLASRTGATEDTTNAGSITLTAPQGIAAAFGGVPVVVTINTATGGAVNNQGQLNITDTANFDAWGHHITSNSPLRIGNVSYTGATNAAPLIVTTTGNADLTWVGTITNLNSADVTLGGADTGILTISNNLTNIKSLTATGNSIAVSGNISTTASTTSGTASGNISLTADTSTITLNNNLTTGNATVTDTAAANSAVSGNISLTAVTGISGAGILTTGNASLTGADAGGTDTVTSGNITLNVTGAGDIGLSGSNTLTIGSATGNAATSLTATTGTITVTSADRVNNGTASTALDISFGTASGGSTNTAGSLAITTDGGAGTAGEIWITSGEALTAGALDTADATSQNINITVTGGNTLTVGSASSLDTDDVTFTADRMAIGAGITAGSATLRPDSAGRAIDLGSTTDAAAALELSSTELSYFTVTTLKVGRSNAGAITISADVTPSNLTNLHLITNSTLTGTAGGIAGDKNLAIEAAGTVNITDAQTAVGTLAANVTGDGYSFTFQNETNGFTVGTVDGVTGITTADSYKTVWESDSYSGGITLSTAGAIMITNNLTTGDATLADEYQDSFSPNSAVSGSISLTAVTGIIGAGILTTGDASMTQPDDWDGDSETVTSGSITLNVTGAGDIGLSGVNALTIGSATFENPLAGVSGLFNNAGNITLTADRVNNGTVSTALDVSFGTASGGETNTAGTLAITTDGGAGTAGEIWITSGEALKVGVLNTADATSQNVNIAVTGGNTLTIGSASSLDTDDVTLTADRMAIGAGITAGTATLRPDSAGRAIDLGSATDAAAALELSSTELSYFTVTTLRVGRSNAGAITISADVTPSNLTNLHLITNSTVTGTAGGIAGDKNLAIEAAGTVNITDVSTAVGTLAANVTGEGNSFTFQNETNGFTVGTVDGVTGITTAASTTSGTASGGITLSTAGAITITNNLTTGNATVADTAAANSAVSGNISLTAVTGISGAGVLTTGNASLTGADAGGTDTVTSGNITLNVTGAGDVGLSGSNALTIGTATGNVATSLTATTGNITVTSADRVNNGTASTALDVSFGTASGGSTNTAGSLAITTDGGAGTAGEIWITSGEALTAGVLNTADATSQNVNIAVTGGNTLTIGSASSLDTDDVTFTADRMAIGAGITAGTATLRPDSAGRAIDLGSTTDSAAALELSSTELSYFTVTTLRVGRSNAGAITISADVTPSNLTNLHLITNSTLTGTAGGIAGDKNLAIEAAGTVNMTDASTAVGTLAANVTGDGNSFTFQNETNGFTVGTVDGVTGITTADSYKTVWESDSYSGGITLSTAGAIMITNNLTTGDATLADEYQDSFSPNSAVSGSISLTAVTGIIGAGILTTGDASMTNPDDWDWDVETVTSGSITLNVTGAGDIGLSGVNALTIGSATFVDPVAGLTGLNATAGNISLTADRVNNGTVSTALDVSFGTASGGETNAAGTLAITTDGGAGTAGEIWITSGEALTLGTLNTADATSQNINIVTTGNAALTWSGASSLDTDAVTLGGAGTGALTISAAQTLGSLTATGSSYSQTDVDISAGSGNITISADSIAITNNTLDNAFQTTGTLTLKPYSAGTAMSLAGASAFDLSTTEIADLTGTSTPTIITIGDSGVSIGAMTIGGAVGLSGKTLTLNAGSINGAGLITAATVDLNAATGIGNTTALELAVTTITADSSTSGNIDIDNALGTAVTVTTLTTLLGGNILFEQSGGGAVSFTTVSTGADGSPAEGEADVTLNSDSGNLTIGTSVTALGLGDITYNTTTSGNVILTGTTTAASDEVTVNSVGSINGAGLITAATVDLNAATGIGNTTALELAVTTITADSSTSGNIDIDNALGTAVTVTTLTTLAGGNILFEQSGGGAVSFTTVSTGADGSPAEGEADVTLSSDNGNLTIGTSVTALGLGDITYNTTTAGNVILTGTTTAAADEVTVNSVGNINGGSTITANTATLNAVTAGLTTQPTMDVTNLNLTFTGVTGGWSGDLLAGPALSSPVNVTVTAPGTVRVNGWNWNSTPTVNIINTGSYTNSYLSNLSFFLDKLRTIEKELITPWFLAYSRMQLEEEEDIIDIPDEAQAIDDFVIQQ